MNGEVPGLYSDLNDVAASALADRLCTGLAAAVWKDGKTVWSFAGGTTCEPEALSSALSPPLDHPTGTGELSVCTVETVEHATLFDAASLTKPLATAPLVMKAWETGALDLDAPLGRFLDGLPAATAALPIRALMTHTAGLPAIPALHLHFQDPTRLDRAEAAARLLAIEPERPVGAQVLYSCTGYQLLGLVLEKLGDRLLGELFKEELAVPAGLSHAGFAPSILPDGMPEQLPHAAATEYCTWRKRRIQGQVHDESAYCLGGHAGNAGLFLNLESALALGSLYLQEGWYQGRQLLQPSTIASMLLPFTTGMEEQRSLAFRYHDADTSDGPLWPATAFGHTGFTGTSIMFEPRHRIMAVLLTNRVYFGRDATQERIVAFRKRFHSTVWSAFC
ncbi:MAG: serine hydrolase, partial [Rectinemataceae bacterium]|nr:beta-lactamase family protein [Spirochaetaceae bacterium]